MGLSGMVSVCISSSELLEIFHESNEVGDIMLQVSNFATSYICDGDGNQKVPIREESFKGPTPTFWRDIGGLWTNRILPITCELESKKPSWSITVIPPLWGNVIIQKYVETTSTIV